MQFKIDRWVYNKNKWHTTTKELVKWLNSYAWQIYKDMKELRCTHTFPYCSHCCRCILCNQRQPVYWRFQSPGTFFCDKGTVAPDSSAFKHQELLSQWKRVTSQKICIFSNGTAQTPNLRDIHLHCYYRYSIVMSHISMICLCPPYLLYTLLMQYVTAR